MKPKNVSEENNVKEAGEKARLQRNKHNDDVHFLMSSDHGQRFIWRVLAECGVSKLSFNHSGSITSFNEGARDVGHKIIDMLSQAEPTYYPKLMINAHEKGFNDV